MRVRKATLTKKQRVETLDALYTAASSLRGRDQMKLFLRDLLTESERIMLGRRILIARKLLAGETYDYIEENMGVGRDTIWRVQGWLSDLMPGYEQAIQGMEQEFKKRKQRAEQDARLVALKKKYPLHFLLFSYPKSYLKKQKRIPR